MTEQFREGKGRSDPLEKGKEWWRKYPTATNPSEFWDRVRDNSIPNIDLLRSASLVSLTGEKGNCHQASVELLDLRIQGRVPNPEDPIG